MRSILFLSVCFALALMSCRNQDPFQLEIQGRTLAAHNSEASAGVEIELWEKVLDGGSLSSTPELAATAVSDASGNFTLNFDRKNALEYDLRYSGSQYVTGNLLINPESVSPSATYCVTLSVPVAAGVSTRLVNNNPEDDGDEVRFRFLNPSTNCVCCDTSEVILSGMDVDHTWDCTNHAGEWLRYFVEIDKTSATSFVHDSLLTVAGETVELVITY